MFFKRNFMRSSEGTLKYSSVTILMYLFIFQKALPIQRMSLISCQSPLVYMYVLNHPFCCLVPLQFGDSQKLRMVRILRSNVMVRVGGGWESLREFLMKNDPCRCESTGNIWAVVNVWIDFARSQKGNPFLEILYFLVFWLQNAIFCIAKFWLGNSNWFDAWLIICQTFFMLEHSSIYYTCLEVFE